VRRVEKDTVHVLNDADAGIDDDGVAGGRLQGKLA
jgi:hypothetical protein